MRVDNLFGNCQHQFRTIPKIIGGTFRIKPVKHFRQCTLWSPGSNVFDDDKHYFRYTRTHYCLYY